MFGEMEGEKKRKESEREGKKRKWKRKEDFIPHEVWLSREQWEGIIYIVGLPIKKKNGGIKNK